MCLRKSHVSLLLGLFLLKPPHWKRHTTHLSKKWHVTGASALSFILHSCMYSPPNYTKAIRRSPMDGGDNDAQHFPLPAYRYVLLQSFLPCKASVTNKGYHYQHLCEQNGHRQRVWRIRTSQELWELYIYKTLSGSRYWKENVGAWD